MLNKIANILTATLMTMTVGIAQANAYEIYIYSESPYKNDSDYDLFVYNDCDFTIDVYAEDYDSGISKQENSIKPGEKRHIIAFPKGTYEYYDPFVVLYAEHQTISLDTEFTFYDNYSITYDQDKIIYACD